MIASGCLVDLFTIKILIRFLEFKDQGNSSDNKALSLGQNVYVQLKVP